MSVGKRYLLDANAFIEPRNRYYGFDICPGYWSALIAHNRASRIFSIDRVRGELVPQRASDRDQLARWIDQELTETFFKKTEDQAVIDKFQEMVQWVYRQNQFNSPAKAEFASVADGWVVAFAAVNSLVVVTHEQYAPDAQRKVPMPNVCLEFDVDYVDTFAMLRDLGEKFIRSTKRKTKRR
jgi:hypothetical protein